MTLDLEQALIRVNKIRSRPKLTKSQKMSFKVLDKLAAEGKLKDTWVVEAVKVNLSEEEKIKMDKFLDSLVQKPNRV
jgi:hypothetical protein